MRPVAMFCTLVLLPGFCAAQAGGQATVISGYAGTWAVPPGAYALPSSPLVTTPSIESVPPPLIVGASSATGANIVGASNSTLAAEPGTGAEQGVSYPLWTPAFFPQLAPQLAPFSSGSRQESRPAEAQDGSFDLGLATFQSDYGAARLAANSGPRSHAAKTYTNDDLARLQQNTGEVKFRDKSEHLN
jgi:hypothetical protein